MTDPNEIARGIAMEERLKKINGAISNVRQGRMSIHHLRCVVIIAIKEADSDGYLRGRVDEAKECDAHAKREYRRGVEESKKAVELLPMFKVFPVIVPERASPNRKRSLKLSWKLVKQSRNYSAAQGVGSDGCYKTIEAGITPLP
jgi:hypothetical protein